jgi:hypothetical protein
LARLSGGSQGQELRIVGDAVAEALVKGRVARGLELGEAAETRGDFAEAVRGHVGDCT